jgi:hypothetical protein
MLNGRDCNVCDCLCANWPIDTLYTRRYVRAKYGLALRLQRNPFSLASWTGTYWDDFWCVPRRIPPVSVNTHTLAGLTSAEGRGQAIAYTCVNLPCFHSGTSPLFTRLCEDPIGTCGDAKPMGWIVFRRRDGGGQSSAVAHR